MAERHIAPLLLAAGQSRRFGSDKLLHPLTIENKTEAMILHSLKPWLAVFETLNVVVRQDNPALLELLQQSDVRARLDLINATDAQLGMSASLKSGIEATAAADGWLVGLADMPYIPSSVIQQSKTALEAGASITQPCFGERRGHPVGFAARFRPDLLTLSGDKGARDILAAADEQITIIRCPDDSVCQDIDHKDAI